MSNTDNQSVKVEIINNVIVAMTYYLSSDVLEMLERVLTKNLVDVVIERINTLPMEMKMCDMKKIDSLINASEEQKAYLQSALMHSPICWKDGRFKLTGNHAVKIAIPACTILLEN